MRAGAPLASHEIESLPLLDEVGCRAVASAVMRLDTHWVARHPLAPFFTLGAASPFDAAGDDGPEAYLALARQLNPLLDDAFEALFERLSHALAVRLAAPVCLAEGQARPGFHIYLPHAEFEQPGAQTAGDVQHRWLDWDGQVPEAVLSFCLPLLSPRGAGLEVWPYERDAWLSLTSIGRSRVLEDEACQELPFVPGTLLLHTGSLVLRRAGVRHAGPQDVQMTLQGYGVRLNGRWHLYG